jgi:hypothetical protein
LSQNTALNKEKKIQPVGRLIILANVDDDNLDGFRDFEDDEINGEKDLEDLSSVVVEKEKEFRIISHNQENINIFIKNSEGKIGLKDNEFSSKKELFIEAKSFATKDIPRDFDIELVLSYEGSKNPEIHTIKSSLAPFVMLPNSADTKTFYIATGIYNNNSMISKIKPTLDASGVTLHTPHYSGDWQEMWMQDTLEMGYAQLPNKSPMYVVMNGIRGYDTFGPTLLGSDMGLITIGSVRNLTNGDDWADWFGNLEVTPPTSKYPLGRVYYGLNTSTGVGLHPDIVAFFEAQKAQPPFWIETGYLTIKHVDEIFNFVKSSTGEDFMIIGSTERGLNMNFEFSESFLSSETGLLFNKEKDRIYNLKIQKILSDIKIKTIKETGFSKDHIIELPVLYKSGHNIWSNPINSVFINGTIITGETYLPTLIRKCIEDEFLNIGLQTKFVPDKVYQDRYGNIHCSSNTQKLPLFKDYSHLVY